MMTSCNVTFVMEAMAMTLLPEQIVRPISDRPGPRRGRIAAAAADL
jgi:hypothetical protein